MQNNSILSAVRVTEFEKLWKKTNGNLEIFYDKRVKAFILKRGFDYQVITIPPGSQYVNVVKTFTLEMKDTVIQLALSRDLNFLAIQTGFNLIRIFKLATKEEHKVSLGMTEKSSSKIYLFEWIWQSPHFNFVIVQDSGVHIAKITPDKFSVKELAFVAQPSSMVWFEPSLEILLLGTYDGVLHPIYISHYRPKHSTKHLKGPAIKLDLREDIGAGGGINQQTSMLKSQQTEIKKNTIFFAFNSISNLNFLRRGPQEDDIANHRHKILFVNLYGDPYVIHLNSFLGKLFLYQIQGEKVNLQEPAITIPSENLYTLSVMDNLIVVHNLSEQLSFIYDIRKSNAVQTVGAPQRISHEFFLFDSKKPLEDQDEIMHLDDDLLEKEQPDAPTNDNESTNIEKGYFAPDKDSADGMLYSQIGVRPSNNNQEEFKQEYSERSTETNQATDPMKLENAEPVKSNPQESEDKSGKDVVEQSSPETSDRTNGTKQKEDTDEPEPQQDQEEAAGHLSVDESNDDSSQKKPDTNPGEEESKESPDDLDDYTRPRRTCTPSPERHLRADTSIRETTSVAMFASVASTTRAKETTIYSNKLRFLEDEYIVDPEQKAVFRLQVIAEKILKVVQDKVEAFQTTLRRSQSKPQALNYLRELISNKQEITTISYILNKICESYKITMSNQKSEDGLKSQKEIEEAMRNRSKSILTTHPNLITQSDLHHAVFSKLMAEEDVDKVFMVEVLLEYFRVCLEYDLGILLVTQTIFLRLIIETKQFGLLCSLIQFHSLRDSQELAEILVFLGSEINNKYRCNPANPFLLSLTNSDYYPHALQLGLDMLHRLKNVRAIIDYLLSRGNVIQALNMSKRAQFESLDIKAFLDASLKPNANCSKEDVINYLLHVMLKERGETKSAEKDEKIKNAIREFQQKNSTNSYI